MKITIKYYGVIAELMGANDDIIVIDKSSISIAELNQILLNKNNALKDQDYKIAINQSIDNSNIKIYENDQIALLPPFSGG